MGGGRGKSSEIDKISSETKALLAKLLKQQKTADARASKTVASDTKLLGKQMDLQNASTANVQQLYSQMVQQQSGVAEQYKTGLAQQLNLLQQQNSLLGKQANEQTSYYKSQNDMAKQQLNLQLQQKKKAESEAQYGSALQQSEAKQAGSQANGLMMQINRRRSYQNAPTNRRGIR
jgi:phage-related minor tail protein